MSRGITNNYLTPLDKEYYSLYGNSDSEDEETLRHETKEEARALRTKTDQKMKGTLKIAKTCVQELHSMEEQSSSICHQVGEQGERLRNIQKKVDHMHDNLAIGSRYIGSIGSIFTSWANSWRADPAHTVTPMKDHEYLKEANSQITNTLSDDHKMGVPQIPQKFQASQDVSGRSRKMQQFDREMDQCCDEMRHSIANIKNQMLTLNKELTEQNDNIKTISHSVDHLNVKIPQEVINIRKCH